MFVTEGIRRQRFELAIYVGRIYLRCRPANLLALPSLLAFTRRRRRRFRRKGWPPPTVGTPGQLTTCRRAPQECRAPPSPLQWPVVTHNRPPVALRLSGLAAVRPPSTAQSYIRRARADSAARLGLHAQDRVPWPNVAAVLPFRVGERLGRGGAFFGSPAGPPM